MRLQAIRTVSVSVFRLSSPLYISSQLPNLQPPSISMPAFKVLPLYILSTLTLVSTAWSVFE